MRKLEDKFEDIFINKAYGSYGDTEIVLTEAKDLCAQEAKNIAIEFHNYIFYTVEPGDVSTIEELFDKFIEEYYG